MILSKGNRGLLVKVLFYFLFFLFSPALFAQQTQAVYNREFNLSITNFLKRDTANLKIYDQPVINYYSLTKVDSALFPRSPRKNYFFRKIRKESFAQIKSKDFFLQLDPIFNFNGGVDLPELLKEKLYTNSRGVWVRGNIGKNFSFESAFLENQSTFPSYIDDFAESYAVIPGLGRWKKFKLNGYDYAASSGSITYAPWRFLIIQAGHGKPFIGNGYRSLLLSDNAFNFPFLKMTIKAKKFTYSVIYSSLQVVDKVRNYTTNLNEPLFKKKSATFHYLTFYPENKKTLSISLFQGTIFQVRNSDHPYFNWNVLNPLIYSSALQYGLNRSPNVLTGAAINYVLKKDFEFYGQCVVDDFSFSKNSIRRKTGFQLGAKYFNVAGLKNLIFQLEYNQVRPYTYAHSISAESYSHYGQSLAHPIGANFKEWVGFLNYHFKDIFVELKMNYITYGADSASKSYGKEIFSSNNIAANGLTSKNNTFLQGVKTNLNYQEFKLSYLINPASTMNVFIQVINRKQTSSLTDRNNTLIYLGVKTSLFNNYFDF